jgi:hypothetical protein
LEVALLGGAVVVGARDLHAQHERVRVRLRGEPHVAREVVLGVLHLAALEGDHREVVERADQVGPDEDGAAQIRLGIRRASHALQAQARREIRLFGRGIERVGGGALHEAEAPVRVVAQAQEPAVIVQHLGVVGRERERLLEGLARGRILAQLHVHEPLHVVGGDVAGVVLDRVARLVQRHGEAAAREVLAREGRVDLGAAMAAC